MHDRTKRQSSVKASRRMNDLAKPLTTVVIEPDRRGGLIDLAELWQYREVISILVWRDYKVRYRQTALGILWVILQPLATMAIFSLILGKLARMPSDGVPYPLFALAGLVPWGYFQQAVTSASTCLLNNKNLVQKVYFPRLALPIASILSYLVNLVPSLILLLVVMLFYGMLPPMQVAFLPLFIILAVVSSLGLGSALAAGNLRYRDVNYIIPFMMQILMFVTPVVYPSSLLPEEWRAIYAINPMSGVADGFRWCLLGTDIDLRFLAISIASSIALLFLGIRYFRRTEGSFADII